MKKHMTKHCTKGMQDIDGHVPSRTTLNRLYTERKEFVSCLVRTLDYLKYLSNKWNDDNDESTYPDWLVANQHIEDVVSVLAGFKVERSVEDHDNQEEN